MSATLVLGASINKERYSNLAILKLVKHGHKVYAIGNKEGEICGVEVKAQPVPDINIDSVSIYLRPSIQKEYYEYILSLNPRRIIFNPGTENPEFDQLARINGIETLQACTLVMLNLGNY